MLQKQEKSLHLSLKQTELQELNSVSNIPAKLTSMLSKFLQNQEQLRLNIGKKLKTASLNSRFTGSKKEVYLVTYEFTHQQPQGRFTSFKKL